MRRFATGAPDRSPIGVALADGFGVDFRFLAGAARDEAALDFAGGGGEVPPATILTNFSESPMSLEPYVTTADGTIVRYLAIWPGLA